MSLSPSQQALQAHLLQRVSRTFALTIPRLPPALIDVVSNAYLLCRIIDTIEDELALPVAQKASYYQHFDALLADAQAAPEFAQQLLQALPASAPLGDRELIQRLPEVIAITAQLPSVQQQQLRHCTQVMARGMLQFQSGRDQQRLDSLSTLENYCYYVAGVVGELLTELFCGYSVELAERRSALIRLAVPFGNGLQLTNILKDLWVDQHRGTCWLPQDLFGDADLDSLLQQPTTVRFNTGLTHLIAVARTHLAAALRYTLLIPNHETGIRQFCLWAIGLALLTLRKINRQRGNTDLSSTKITRSSVKATLLVSQLSARHDRLLQTLFSAASLGLPPAIDTSV